MCNNNLQTTSMNTIKPEPAFDADTAVPHRRSRTRTRKPRFLSLNLFPLHPENIQNDTVDYLQDSDAGATLSGLLDTAEYSSEQESPSISCAYREREMSEEGVLVRTAMKRGKERQVSEEKWVRYSEVTSCSAPPLMKPRSLSLKLDYQEILDAWSGKGSLYIVPHEEGDQCPQIVPDSHDDHFLATANNFSVVKESVGNLWSVPDNGCNMSSMKMDEDGGKVGQREASVLRYKEKRQNRLFSKRIRYQVRKLNAEKRPRMKGRFVKRN